MTRIIARFALAAALLVPVLARADEDPAATLAIGRSVGDAVYGASFKNMKDEMTGLDQFKGKTLIVYLWATWCAPCQIEAVDLKAMRKDIGDKPIAFVAIAMSNGDDVRRFVADHGIDYTMLYGGPNAVAMGKTLGNASAGVPFFAIVRDGIVVDAFHGDRTPAQLVALAEKPLPKTAATSR